MKLHTTESEFFSSKPLAQSEFKIQASAKAFKILSSNLYKNKIRAIVRELSANAYDSHVAAGHPSKQFTVHMPSFMNPIFWIRDYGIGLSKDSVLNLYTTYFESTKADSDEYIGALGLGSKSPFSYVDSFTVTSYFNGVKTIYDMSLKGGVPNVAELFECETDEENGVLVSMSVNDTDFNKFASEARYVYKTFKIKPDFTHNAPNVEMNISLDLGEYFYSNDNDYNNNVYAIMGNIAYPIEPKLWNDTILKNIANNRSVFVHFKLGELDITPSREELSYDVDTEAAIQRRLSLLTGKLVGDAIDDYKDFTCPRLAYKHLTSNHAFIRNYVVEKIIINGKPLSDWIDDLKWSGVVNTNMGTMLRYRRMSVYADRVQSEWRGSSRYYVDNISDIDANKCIIYNNDDKKNPLQALRGMVCAKIVYGGAKVYVFDTHSYDKASMDSYNDLIAKCGDNATVYVNSVCGAEYRKHLPKTPTVSRGRALNSKKFVYNGDYVALRNAQFYVDDIDNYEGFYLLKFYDDYVNEQEHTVIKTATIEAYMMAYNIKEVIVVRKSHWKRIANNNKAKPLHLECAEKLDTLSGRMIALKYGISSITLPNWATEINEKDPSILLDMLPKTRYHGKRHHAYEFMNAMLSDARISDYTSKEGKKQLDLFKGKRKAIEKRLNTVSKYLNTKYNFIRLAVNNMSSGVLINHLDEIKVLIKHLK